MKHKTEIARERARDRNRARKIVHVSIGTDVFLAAQNWTCPICGGPIRDYLPSTTKRKKYDELISVDHVYHLASHGRCNGNLLLVHTKCNQLKNDRPPSQDEQRMLGLVNRCLGYRKGIYKAAKHFKGEDPAMYRVPEPDFYNFCISLWELFVCKVLIR
jgi:hypothetical protein